MKYETKEFTIKCKMNERWIPSFLGMLKKMEYLGGIGASRFLEFYSDGDGDYRPKFEWNEGELPQPGNPLNWDENDLVNGPPDKGYTYDAG